MRPIAIWHLNETNIRGEESSYLNLHVKNVIAYGLYDAVGAKRSLTYKVQPETLFTPVENSVKT